MIVQNYKGYLLAAHPRRQEPTLQRSVILVLDHDSTGAIGLQINKPFTNDITLETVMQNVGMHTDLDEALYCGGSEASNRIHVLHSLDWYTNNTTKITEHIGVSHDVSVLAAISKNEGPEQFRVVAGFTRWLPGHLEGEILGQEPWTIHHSWSWVPAESEMVFGLHEQEQWHSVISQSSRLQVNSWF